MWTDHGLRPPTAPVLARGSDTRPAEVLAVGTNNGGGGLGNRFALFVTFREIQNETVPK